MEGKKVVALVNQFERFHSETGIDDLKAFSVWLNRELNKVDTVIESKVIEANRSMVWNIHRLSKYFRWYSKSFLNAHGLNSMDEYFFLVSIYHRGNPAKNEVYKDTISELTTGAQMMRRLIEIGLVKEVIDHQDKRIKRVVLTVKGKRTREKVFEASKKDLVLKAGNLSDSERAQLLKQLVYLEKFHSEIYQLDANKSIEELIVKYYLNHSN